MFLVFDTETTGLPNPRHYISDERQPHCVQLAAIKFDANFNIDTVVDMIARPDGWTIPPNVAAIHGITTERALKVGVPEQELVNTFQKLFDSCTTIIGHNIKFDKMIMDIAASRSKPRTMFDWKYRENVCTMDMLQDVIQIPPTPKMVKYGRTGYKAPRLSEAYQFMFGKDFEDAHNALADVKATFEI